VAAGDVLLERLGVELLRLLVPAGEALRVVRDEDAAVARALHRAEHARSRARALEAGIEEALERARRVLVVERLGERVLARRLLHTLVFLGEAEFCERATRNEEAGSVSCGWIGSANR
jgi:hypothetical protein